MSLTYEKTSNVYEQPLLHAEMSVKTPSGPGCSSLNQQSSCTSCPHAKKWRRFILPAFVSSVALVIMFCLIGVAAGALGYKDCFGLEYLLTRRDETSDPNSSNPFVDNKYYLIVLLVGLFVVILLGIMLSAWCCKGVFQNPLCCPCYLCACCGGLACLECIGCGLCIEAAGEV